MNVFCIVAACLCVDEGDGGSAHVVPHPAADPG